MDRLSVGLFLVLYSFGIIMAIFFSYLVWVIFLLAVLTLFSKYRNTSIIVIFIILCGFLRVCIEDKNQSKFIFNEGTFVTIRGILLDNVFSTTKHTKNIRRNVVIQARSVKVNNKWLQASIKICLRVQGAIEKDLLRGTYIEVFATIHKIQLPRNPGEFNRQLFWKSKGIYYELRTQKTCIRTLSLSIGCPVLNWAKNLQAKICNYLIDQFGERVGGVAAALCFGEKYFILPLVKQNFMKSGAMHLLAISGFHIIIVSGILLRACLFVFCDYYVSLFFTILSLVAYTLIAGMSVSTVRATTVMCVYLFAPFCGREKNAMRSLLITALVFLFFDPYQLIRIDFQLSFTVCFFILYLKAPRNSNKIHTSVFVTSVACVSSSPITSYYFYSLTPIAIFSNFLLYIPIYIGLLLIIFWVFSPISLTLLKPYLFIAVYYNFYFLLWLLSYLAEAPWGYIHVKQPSALLVFVFYLFLVVLKPRRIKSLCFIFVIFCVFVLSNREQNCRMTVLDVGHGDCILLEQNKKIYLYDCGSYRVLPFLRYRGINRIHAVIISHPDIDHYRALFELLRNVKIDKIICNSHFIKQSFTKQIYKFNVEVQVVADNEQVDGFTFLYPGQYFQNRTSDNEHSLGMHWSINGHKVLLLGDMEDTALNTLMNDSISSVTLMQVPHHGSQNNYMEPLLRKWRPKYATLSSKKSFPSKCTLDLYSKYSVKVFATYDCGAIIIDFNKQLLFKTVYKK
ncbi:DNA internalization-related competence protein ComEC/Rec2 [Candidatus Uabimicrobium sp. HlEnr_7]|uniref:DNA internalization-related competence protein ComEC/Rec2 n=1 Tax=Candidatus Uabimicrobium helgolandensis TaxID=3095367 RepID=UPI0035588396